MRSWEGSGRDFDLPWGNRTWTLKVDDTHPGLRVRGESIGPLLGLEGLAAVGRWAPDALSGASLTGVERHFERVEATYAPEGWDDLTVRAAWSPFGDEGVDLEIQVSTRSVGRLKALEVKLLSQLPEPGRGPRPKRWVEPRDALAAGLSYDGRERDVRGLTTLPPADEINPLAPRIFPVPWDDGWSYIEMVLPNDAARRITEASKPASLGHTTRYGLFGHDLERGVVLRGRLRGIWTDSKTAKEDALDSYEQFLREPPPLGT